MQLPVGLLLGCGVAMPWLWPWAPPPTPSAPGMLVAWIITALCWGLTSPDGLTGFSSVQRSVSFQTAGQWKWLWAAIGLTLLALYQIPVVDLALLAAPWGACLCMALAAQAARACQTSAKPGVRAGLAWGLLWAGVLSAVIGGLQYGGFLHEPTSSWPWLHASPQEEAYGQLRQRNQFGSLMSLGLAAWIYLSQTGWPGRWGRWLAWPTMAALVLGAVASSSRTGALTWVALAGLALVWPTQSTSAAAGPGPRTGAWAALTGFLSLSWILPQWVNLAAPVVPKMSALERLATQAEGGGVCESRVVLWRHVLELSMQKPWLGWGWGELDFAHATQEVSGERFCGQLGHAHNLLLQVAVEWGWPLALTGLVCLGAWVWQRQPWRARQPVQAMGWSVAGVIGLHSLLEFPLWYGPFQMALGLAVGWIGSAPLENQTGHATRHQRTLSRGLALALLLGSLWASWDYRLVTQVYQAPSQRSTACRQDPWVCANQVIVFHQGRDFARLMQLPASSRGLDSTHQLAERVAHYAPEQHILALRIRAGATSSASEPRPAPASEPP